MNILLIEDNLQFSEHLSATLLKNTYVNRVEQVSSFKWFQQLSGHLRAYDIILVDLVLEWETIHNPSGFRIIETLRKNGNTIPIIVISSSDNLHDIEYAFSIWATDYMGKDIRYKELEVRLFHWYREYCMSNISTKKWVASYYGLRFIQSSNEYMYNNNIIEFTKNMKYLFSLFFNEREKLLSDLYLIEKIWWYNEKVDMKNRLRVNIKRLRLLLGEYGLSSWIRNDWWEGYIFKYRATEGLLESEKKEG